MEYSTFILDSCTTRFGGVISLKSKMALTPVSVLKSSDLSNGARVIFPYLTYYSQKKNNSTVREISVDTIYNCIGIPPMILMIWLSELENKGLIDEHYLEESPDKNKSVIKFKFPTKIENEIAETNHASCGRKFTERGYPAPKAV